MLLEDIKRPTKQDQITAMASYSALAATMKQLKSDSPEIEIEETGEKIIVPLEALKLFSNVLKAMSEGKPISIVPLATEVTTQKAAEILGCSRPHLVKLLEGGKIEFTKVGRHRRIQIDEVMNFKKEMKDKQKSILVNMMQEDEKLGLYDK
jgi:excisionase family DNA binding protein